MEKSFTIGQFWLTNRGNVAQIISDTKMVWFDTEENKWVEAEIMSRINRPLAAEDIANIIIK